MTDDFQEFPKMLYRRGPKNVLETLVVDSADEQTEAGSDWKETPPQPRGRRPGSVNKPKAEESAEAEDEPEAVGDDDAES